MNAATGSLRAWVRSLPPPWQLVAPGLLAWFSTVATQAARESWSAQAWALCALLVLLSGPWLVRLLSPLGARMVAFWGFLIGCVASLLSSGSARPLSRTETLTMALSWALFALTAAAPALPPTEARRSGEPDRREGQPAVRRQGTELGLLAVCLVWCALALSALEPPRPERMAVVVLCATGWSIAALDVIAVWARPQGRRGGHVGWMWLATLSTTLTVAGALGWLEPPLRQLGVWP